MSGFQILSGLLVPPSVARSREAGKKVLRCVFCRADFPLDQEERFGRHVRRCSEAHEGEMQAVIARREETYFTKPIDPEFAAHVRKGGN